MYPWSYIYEVNGGGEQSVTVTSGNTSSKTIGITGNTTVTLVSISTVSAGGCLVTLNSNLNFTYSTSGPGAPVQITGIAPACIGSEAVFTVPPVAGASII